MIFLRLSAEAEQRQSQGTRKIALPRSWFQLITDYCQMITVPCSLITVPCSLITVFCGEFIHKQYQYIQHLRRCAIVGAWQPPVTPAAIHIQVLRTWRNDGRNRHYVAFFWWNCAATKISPLCGCIWSKSHGFCGWAKRGHNNAPNSNICINPLLSPSHRKQCTNQQVYEHYITTLAEKICVLLHKIGVNGNTLHPYSIVK